MQSGPTPQWTIRRVTKLALLADAIVAPLAALWIFAIVAPHSAWGFLLLSICTAHLAALAALLACPRCKHPTFLEVSVGRPRLRWRPDNCARCGLSFTDRAFNTPENAGLRAEWVENYRPAHPPPYPPIPWRRRIVALGPGALCIAASAVVVHATAASDQPHVPGLGFAAAFALWITGLFWACAASAGMRERAEVYAFIVAAGIGAAFEPMAAYQANSHGIAIGIALWVWIILMSSIFAWRHGMGLRP